MPLPAPRAAGRSRGVMSETAQTGTRMDRIDRAILNEIQSNFPLRVRPFREVGRKLGLSEKEVLTRVSRLKKEGIIRRLGANFNSRKLGFTSTLCAAKVPKRRLDEFVAVVNEYPGVTHNYEREADYNIWFTVIANPRRSSKKHWRKSGRAPA